MLSAFGEKHQVVLGYAPLNRKKTWISIFARYETFLTALQYFSYAIAGIPYMGVGRNLAYTTDILKSTNGFSSHLDLLSGDDDLTVNAVARKNNVGIQTDPKSFMYSDPPENLSAFVRQKSRHITTSVRYKMKHQILLAAFSMTHVVFYFSLFFMDPWVACMVFATRILLILLFNYRAFVKLKESDLLLWFPVLDFLMTFYYILMSFTFIFPRKKSW
jgi:cellulose synthase/poly-beta-1,6-N-acetylglucosamine synthase-like glycosyltransferase